MFPSDRLNFINAVFVQTKAFSNDQGEEQEQEEEGSGDGSSGSEAGDGSKDGQSSEDQAIKDPEKKRLSDEAARYRTQLRDEQSAKKVLEQKLREIEDKDKSELEKAQRDLQDLTKENETLKQTVLDQALEVAWVNSGAASLFKNPSTAFKLLDVSQVEIKDGKADAKVMKELADALAKSGDVTLAKDASGDDDGERNPSGAPTNGKSRNNGNANRAELEKRFPALKGRQAS